MLKKNWIGGVLLILMMGLFLGLPFLPTSPNQKVDAKILKGVDSNKVLLFFGYPGCGTECPIVLGEVADFYNQSQTSFSDMAFVFVNLSDLETKQQAQDYVELFHPNFVAYQPEPKELERIAKEFRIKFFKSDEEIAHKRSLFLLRKTQKHWVIEKVFPEGLGSLEFLQNIN